MSSDVTDLIAHARRLLLERSGSQGAEHSFGVAEAAARLAETYGIDPALARLAGLLHDWAKPLADEQLLQAATAHGIPVTEVDAKVPYLLHAPVGAAQAADALPGLPSEVVRAVERHTLGAVRMSHLDMIVFVADMIEDGRDFDGVEELRALVGVASLEELYLAGYASSLMHVISARHHLHPGTVPAWNAALDASKEGR